MGYKTNYTLSSTTDIENTSEFAELFGNTTDYDIDEIGSGIKWYEHETDMAAISTKYPDVIFTLKGIGEDEDTPWFMYFKNGKYYNAEVVLKVADFNESKLR